MCGIAAHFSAQTPAAPLDLGLINHRGPDARGEWISPQQHFWLGNTRLAILDLSPNGSQPMLDPASGNVIVVNGEIYNHLDVRRELGEVAWRGTSDTETLLVAYGRWGERMLERLKGMFAFAIYDRKRGELFVARDRLGIKPLYYTSEAGGIRLASEVKMLTSRSSAPTPASVGAYLQWGSCPEETLLFPEIKVLPAGHAMRIQPAPNEPKIWRYWPSTPRFASSPANAPATLRILLERAVEEHLLSDVPVASFLSGGIDSSIITALAAGKLRSRLETFSVGFAQAGFDETAIALEVAQRYGTSHQRIELSEEEVIAAVTEAVSHFDLPSVDAINTYIVSRAVARRGVKVALSGLGGDELFGGYPSFRDVPRLQWLARLPRALRGLAGERLQDLPNDTSAFVLAQWRRLFFTGEMLARAGLPRSPFQTELPMALPDDFARISWAELTGYMRRMLLRDSDQMSMAVSLELRVPFLDHQLVEYSLGLPAAEKRRYGAGKGLLVEACRDLLPPSVYQRPKAGFVLPMADWMKGPLAAFVAEGLEAVAERQLLPEKFVAAAEAGFQRGQLHWTRLWSMVVLGHFVRRTTAARPNDENFALHSLA